MSLTAANTNARSESEAERVLELHVEPIGRGLEPIVELLPAPVDHDEEVVPRLEDPAEAALQPQDVGLVVELHEVGPRQVGSEVDVDSELEDLGVERPLFQLDVVALALEAEMEMAAGLEDEAQLDHA